MACSVSEEKKIVKHAIESFVMHADKEGHAHSIKEIKGVFKFFPEKIIDSSIKQILKEGFAKKIKGPKGEMHLSYVRKNPSSPMKRALKKAEDFYGDSSLVTEARELKGYVTPESFIDIGTIESIMYESDKFDGELRLYEHEVTKKRRMLLSTDGSTAIFWPPFKLTKRGIEG